MIRCGLRVSLALPVLGGLLLSAVGAQLSVATAGPRTPAVGATPTATPTPSGSPTCGGENPSKDAHTQWVCTFDDEFDATTGDPTALDPSKWLVQRTSASGYRTGPAAHRACYTGSWRNVSVSGGYLRLTVRKTAAPFTCHLPGRNGAASTASTSRYTAGMVSTDYRFNQAYGRFEVKAKLPQSAVKGLQETFWLFPVNDREYGGNGHSGEIDFAEFYSQLSGQVVPYIHYRFNPKPKDATHHLNTVTNECPIRRNRFNTYVAQWQPGTITVLANGKTCLVDKYQATDLRSPAPFDQPFFVVLTQALGINTNAFRPGVTPLPATTLIDYVRVWK